LRQQGAGLSAHEAGRGGPRRPVPQGREPGASGRTEARTGEADEMRQARCQPALRATVAASAAPYGYTLTVWTSGAVLSHARGIPSAAAALLFLAGAVAAYALVAGLAVRGSQQRLVLEPRHAAVWGGLHLFSVGLAIGAASLVAQFVTNPAAWPLGGFLATALYLIVSAGQLAFAHAARPDTAKRQAKDGNDARKARPRQH
jgi:hypothetical protein